MSRPLRLCIFTETYYPVVGGGETQARLLAESLARCGHSVIIMTRRSDPGQARFERHGDVKVYRLSPMGTQHLKKWGLLLSGIPALIRLSRQYDVILVSGFRAIGITALLMSRILNKKCILKADNNGEMSGAFFQAGLKRLGSGARSPAFRLFLGWRNRLFRGADAFIAISSQIAGEYRDVGIDPSKIHRIPNGIDMQVFHPVSRQQKQALRSSMGLREDAPVVVFAGRLVSYKGLPVLLRAWKSLQEIYPAATLLLVGGGSMDIHNCEQQLKEYVLGNGLDGSVRFCGEVNNVHEYLQASDVFVFPTEKEAFGIALIEAMACGLPVIATPVGASKDFLTTGQNALLIQPGDETELQSSLDKLISDQAYAATLAHAALETVRASFDIDALTGSYLRLFNDLAGNAH